MLELIRWTTVHPALVHLPLGLFPLAALAHLVAARRRSARWTFVGDVAAFGAGLTAALAAPFGLVAYFTLEWPGELSTWALIHLVLGASLTALSLAFVLGRMWSRRRAALETRPWPAAALALFGLAVATGWTGGEVLVFHSGAAVKAAGEGLLAPPITQPLAPPRDLEAAMGEVRAAWSAATVAFTESVTVRPSEALFRRIEAEARRLVDLAEWIASAPPEDRGPAVSLGAGGAGLDEEAQHRAEHLREMGTELANDAARLARAAEQRELAEIGRRLGEVGGQCASCHAHLRWQ